MAVPPIALGNETYVGNMRLLRRYDAALADRIEAVEDRDRFPLEPTASGQWTSKVAIAEGLSCYLHSRRDPTSEARRWAQAVPLDEKLCIVVHGSGLGYHLTALFSRLKGDAFLVCIEPSIPLLATALSCVDLTELLGSGRFLILTDDDKARLHARLGPFGTAMMLGTQVARHAPSVRLNERAHDAVAHAITEFIAFTRMSLVTLIRNSRITCRNIAMNLAAYVTTPPIDLLKDRFAGIPGVVISAGPSLARNIEQLARLKGRAVLCAVQTALRPLLERGIVPDIVTSLDYHEMSRKFFDGLPELSRIHLVAEPKATWHVIDAYPGPVSLLDSAWARLIVGEELGARGGLPAGATVAHLAFYLAEYMGCNPIIFVGQDLAYTGHVFYVPGVEIHKAWRGEFNRFCTMEMKEWERIVRNRPILRRVAGNDGGELYTDELLFTYLEQFEKDIAGARCEVINATEGGARIRGTRTMTLGDAADRFCRNPIDPRRFAYCEQTTWRDPSKLGAARRELEARIAELDQAVNICDQLLPIFRELEGLTNDPERFNRRLAVVDELRAKIARDARPFQIINAASQLAEFRRFSADRRIAASELPDAERAARQITRDKEFITAVREGALEVRQMLTDSLSRMADWGSRACV